MAQPHRRPVTRDTLLDRLARATGSTWPEAHDFAEDLTDQQLLEKVETIEAASARPGARRRWQKATTTPQSVIR